MTMLAGQVRQHGRIIVFRNKILVSALVMVALVSGGAIGYVAGYRTSNLDQKKETTIMYANLLGERLLELDAIGTKVDSENFKELLRQEKESFILVAGCGEWYGELKGVPSADLQEFEKAIKLAADSLIERN